MKSLIFNCNGANTAEAGNPGIPRSINMGIRVRLCGDWRFRETDGQSDYPQTAVSHIVRTRHFYFAQRDTTPACFCFPGYSTVIKNTARMVLVKAGNHGFYQYRSGWFYFSLSGANTVEAGNPGIPRSRNMGIMCPAMQRPVFEGGGRFVRLSANGGQLHRPNTIPIFCAAVCRDYRLRTFISSVL